MQQALPGRARREGPVPPPRATAQTAVLQMQRAIGNAAVGRAIERRVLQRAVVNQSERIRDHHLAQMRLRGEETSGYTPPKVNATGYEPHLPDGWVVDALEHPQLDVGPVPGGGFEARVAAVPINRVGYTMHLPVPGPWEAVGRKDFIFGFYGLDTGGNDAGQATLEVVGKPNDAALEEQVETHEDVHAVDIVTRTAEILRAWDQRLTVAHQAGTVFPGATAAAAEAALWQAMGGTPQQIGERLATCWAQDSDAFHRTAQGKSFAEGEKIDDHRVKVTVFLPI